VLEKDEVDQLTDPVRNKAALHTAKKERFILHAVNVGSLSGFVTSGLGNVF
jgi:hypothetical protein